MSDQQPATPPGPNTFVTVLSFLLGIILLLPAVCSLYFARLFYEEGDWHEVFNLFTVAGLVIGAGGVALVRLASRRLSGL